MRDHIRPLLCSSVCVALVFGSLPAFAAPPADPPASEGDSSESPELTRAKELFDSGVARYTAADYEAAVDLWLQSYALIPPSYDNRLILAEIIYNVARAQQKWFEIDKDVKHLRQAREILVGYRDEVTELYPEDQVELERERIGEQITGLDEQIAEWETEQAEREAELAERMRPKYDEEADAREGKRNRAMVGAGAGLSALGLTGVAFFAVGLVMAGNAQAEVAELPLEADIEARTTAIQAGNNGNALMATGAIVGVVFLAAGLPLIGVGVAGEKQRKKRRAEAGGDAQPSAGIRLRGLGPIWLQGGGGLGISGQF
jgi:hypothetical protein